MKNVVFLLLLLNFSSMFISCLSNEDKMKEYELLVLEDNYEEAIPIIKELAEVRHYSPSYEKYGKLLLDGIHIQKDVEKALSLLDSAIVRNDTTAMDDKARFYYHNKDYRNASKFFEMAVNHGSKSAILSYAICCLNADHLPNMSVNEARKKAIEYAQKALSNGNVYAYVIIGLGYSEIYDHSSAFYWWNKGTETADLSTQIKCWNNIGNMYENGKGCKKNYAKSLECFEKVLSLDPNDSYALYHLGLHYREGWGINKDISTALQYLSKAADLGNESARKEYAKTVID